MSDNPNPKHKELLDAIPESLHTIVSPILKKWDQGVHEKLEEVRGEYAGYEPFVKNKIDPKFVEQAVVLAQELQSNPDQVMQKINDTWDLGYVSKDQIPSSKEPEGTEDDGYFPDDIMEHPKVKQMAEALDKLQNEYETDRQTQEEREAEKELEDYLDGLERQAKEDNVPFSREFVTAYMVAGVDGEDALKEYHKIIGQAGTQQPNNEGEEEPPPNVMGSEGSEGSGSETPTFDYAGSKETVNTFVADLIKAQNESGD